MDWQELLRYPFADDNWVLKMLVGSLVCLVPAANLILCGYAIACMEMGMRGRRRLPDLEHWADYARDAAAALIILLAYLFIPIILTLVLSAIPIVGTVLGAIALLLAGSMIPMALAAYAARREITDAFSIVDILTQIGGNLDSYLSAYLFIIISGSIGLAIIISLPYLACLGAIIIFYSTTIFSYLIGFISQGV